MTSLSFLAIVVSLVLCANAALVKKQEPSSLDICLGGQVDLVEGEAFFVTTPNFGNGEYDDNSDCSLTLRTGDTPLVVSLNFSSVDIEQATRCPYDYLCFNGIKTCGRWAANQEYSFLIPESSNFTLVFVSDLSVTLPGAKIFVEAKPVGDGSIKQIYEDEDYTSNVLPYEEVTYSAEYAASYVDRCVAGPVEEFYKRDENTSVSAPANSSGHHHHNHHQHHHHNSSANQTGNGTEHRHHFHRQPHHRQHLHRQHHYRQHHHHHHNSTGSPANVTESQANGKRQEGPSQTPSANSSGHHHHHQHHHHNSSANQTGNATEHRHHLHRQHHQRQHHHHHHNSTGSPANVTEDASNVKREDSTDATENAGHHHGHHHGHHTGQPEQFTGDHSGHHHGHHTAPPAPPANHHGHHHGHPTGQPEQFTGDHSGHHHGHHTAPPAPPAHHHGHHHGHHTGQPEQFTGDHSGHHHGHHHGHPTGQPEHFTGDHSGHHHGHHHGHHTGQPTTSS